MPPPSDRRAGFMLVEVPAALLVTAALVATVLPFAGRLIARWQAGQGSLLEGDAWMQVIARVSDDVAQAMPLHVPGNAAVLAFGVEPARIDLVRPALGGVGGPGELERVTYRIETIPGGETLVRRATPVASPAGERASEVIVMSGPYRMAFTAVGRDGSRRPWTGMATMPVRLDLTVAGRAPGSPAFGPVALPIAAQATVAAVVPLLRRTGAGDTRP